MPNLALIQPSRVDFDTQQSCDWLDGLPLVGQPGYGGALAGSANAGNGGLVVASVGAGTAYGAHTARIAAVGSGLTRITAADPSGTLTGQGVVGLPLYAAGITLTLTQGATPFAVGDAFALGVVPVPVDLTGIRFDLDARASLGAATIALTASSAPADGSTPTIVAGGAGGTLAMRVLKAAMTRLPVGTYPYSILATDPVAGLTVPAFYGLIHHVATAAQIAN